MICHRIHQVVAFLNVRYQSEQGLTQRDLEMTGEVLGRIADDVGTLEKKKADVISMMPYLAERQAKKWCEQQGLIEPPHDPNGSGDVA